MGIQAVLTGTILSILLLFPPANLKLSLVDGSQSVIMVDYVVGSTAQPNVACAIIVDMIQVRPFQPRVCGYETREDEGRVQDGYILHFPAPT